MLVTCVGILVADIIAADLPKVSDPGELTFTGRDIELHIGGHAANVSIDLRKLGLQQGTVSSVGAVGDDIFGTYIQGVFERFGVIHHLQRVKDTATSKDLILVVRGQDRRYHCDVGANWHLGLEQVSSVLEEQKPTVFYVGGVGFMGEFDEKLPTILQKAKEKGCLNFVDPVTPYRHGWDIVLPCLSLTDIFHCNDLEAALITGEKEPKKAARAMLERGAKLVVISLGHEGLIAVTKDAVLKMPAFKIPVIDPTGAGDAFCAGVIGGIVRSACSRRVDIAGLSGDELAQILLEGEAAGAACVTMVGTTTGVTEENVTKIISDQGSSVLKSLDIEKS
ncbi:MAG: carbohydrate kinase family protein [Candidatus Bathyarchaeota archaeon]|nr:carbohydrate kinase family protein [Candidatus Bathyarchaeota archaeon]